MLDTDADKQSSKLDSTRSAGGHTPPVGDVTPPAC